MNNSTGLMLKDVLKEQNELLKEQNELLKHRNTQLTVLHHDLEAIAEKLDNIWGAFP